MQGVLAYFPYFFGFYTMFRNMINAIVVPIQFADSHKPLLQFHLTRLI